MSMTRERGKLEEVRDELKDLLHGMSSVPPHTEHSKLRAIIDDLDKHCAEPIRLNMRHLLVGWRRMERRGFKKGMVTMAVIWLFAATVGTCMGGCFSDTTDDGDSATAGSPDSGSSAEDTGEDTSTDKTDGETSQGPTTSDSGSTGVDTSADTSESTTLDTSTTGSTTTTGGWGPGPFYGPCSALGTCDGAESCVTVTQLQTACGAPCTTKADCPPPPPGQESICKEIDGATPGAECWIPCTGDWDNSSCPTDMHCQVTDNVCVFYDS